MMDCYARYVGRHRLMIWVQVYLLGGEKGEDEVDIKVWRVPSISSFSFSIKQTHQIISSIPSISSSISSSKSPFYLSLTFFDHIFHVFTPKSNYQNEVLHRTRSRSHDCHHSPRCSHRVHHVSHPCSSSPLFALLFSHLPPFLSPFD